MASALPARPHSNCCGCCHDRALSARDKIGVPCPCSGGGLSARPASPGLNLPGSRSPLRVPREASPCRNVRLLGRIQPHVVRTPVSSWPWSRSQLLCPGPLPLSSEPPGQLLMLWGGVTCLPPPLTCLPWQLCDGASHLQSFAFKGYVITCLCLDDLTTFSSAAQHPCSRWQSPLARVRRPTVG